MYRLFIVLSLILAQQKTYASNPSMDYILQYKEIAVSEMHRTGIPASIKMAQALLESGSGKSSLATEANNHFGIKCGGMWNGDTYYREDDDYNKKGDLIKSCFRKFHSVEESYSAHSNFLTDQNRYEFLFGYARDDYKAWAKGLKKAGYATDKKYPKKLIDIIEKYELYNLDYENDPILAYNDPQNNRKTKWSSTHKSSKHTSKLPNSDVASSDSKSSSSSSERSSRRSKKYSSDAKVHLVLDQQSIAEIAMIYGLDETSIRLRNRLPKDAEPVKGEKIYLRKKISLLKRPKFTRIPNGVLANANDEFIF
jgi:hypothetical protein